MNREEAMDKAVEIIDVWCEPPTKANGYPVDGWKTPSLAEKVDAAEKLANFLWEVEDVAQTLEAPTLSGKDFYDA